jgi:tRNA(fMet)-specific endonuclease VapC
VAVLIDTSTLIAYERGVLDLPTQIKSRAVTGVSLSIITASELLHGVARAVDPVVRARRSQFVDRLLQNFPLILIDLRIARTHAQLWADLELAGAMIARHDLWIAATCLELGATIITAYEREFRQVPGLAVQNWLAS